MSDIDTKELLGKVSDTDLRSQLEAAFGALEGSALRQQVTTLADENKTLKTEKRVRTYKEAGVPEGSFDVLDKVYEGELTPDAIRAFAQEKGFAVGEVSAAAPDPAAERSAGEERTAALNAGALPVRDASLDDQFAEAVAKGDTALAGRLNAQKLAKARAS